jgi:hypothetical protein
MTRAVVLNSRCHVTTVQECGKKKTLRTVPMVLRNSARCIRLILERMDLPIILYSLPSAANGINGMVQLKATKFVLFLL